MNIYFQILASVAVLLLGYKPFRFCRLQWKIAVSTIMYWSTDAGTHRLKYMKQHERSATMDNISTLHKTAKMYLVFMLGLIATVAVAICIIFNIITI